MELATLALTGPGSDNLRPPNPAALDSPSPKRTPWNQTHSVTYYSTAIISDLHGNIQALRVAIRDALSRGARRFVCLGDVVGYGARPCEALDIVMELCSETNPSMPDGILEEGEGPFELQPGLCLQGNHEHALLHSAEDFNPKARSAIEWTKSALNGHPNRERKFAYWDFLDAIESRRTDEVALFAHGSPRDPVREYLLPRDIRNSEKMEANFAAMDRNVCFVGHSHVPAIYYEGGRIFQPQGVDGPYDLGVSAENKAIVNVGSVGQPRDGDPRLSYVMFDGSTVTFVRLEYEHELASAEIRAVPELPDFLATRLAEGR